MRRGIGPRQIVIMLIFAVLAAVIIGYAMKITVSSGPARYDQQAESAVATTVEE